VSCVETNRCELEEELEEKNPRLERENRTIEQLEGQGETGVDNGAQRRNN
jgi:hypothetical protein